MKILLTLNKKNTPVEIETDNVQLITVMDDGCTRIVTDKEVFYVKESLETIAMLRAGIKDPGEIDRLRSEMKELQKKIGNLTDQLNAARIEYVKKDKELRSLLEKAQRASIMREESLTKTPFLTIEDVLSSLL